MTDTLSIAPGRQTDGTLRAYRAIDGRRRRLAGSLVTVTLPDDWQTLLDRVAALEAAARR